MEAIEGRHVWLYQYNPAKGASWLLDLEERRRVDWRISRRAKATKVGDRVVFWQSGDGGGLRGLGRVIVDPYFEQLKGKKDQWRVPVQCEVWLKDPISREKVRSANALREDNNFWRMSQGANFPLHPKELQRILSFLGVSPSEQEVWLHGLLPHAAALASPPTPAAPDRHVPLGPPRPSGPPHAPGPPVPPSPPAALDPHAPLEPSSSPVTSKATGSSDPPSPPVTPAPEPASQAGIGWLVGDGSVGIPRMGNDNVWNQDVKDSLGAKREAEAFAGLAVSAEFVPPLAVGVFGDWGSGKSFFMRLVYERVKELSDQGKLPAQPAHAGGGAELLADVVQIRFNAWHYLDTNLWASLVDHIFSELDKATASMPPEAADKLFEQLTTARELTLASAERLMQRRKEHGDAAVFVADAQAKLQKKRQDGASVDKWAFAQALFEEQLGDSGNLELRAQAKELGIGHLVASGKELKKAVEEIDATRKEAGAVLTSAWKELRSGRGLASFMLTMFLVAGVVYVLREVLTHVFQNDQIRDAIGATMLAACGVISAVIGVLRTATVHVRAAMSFLRSARDKFDKASEDALKAPMEIVKARQDELARLAAAVAEGEARLAASTERVGEAAREYNAKTGRGRLLSFVRSRAAGEDYSKHLGLVSTVRKDFEELSELVADSQSPSAKRKHDREKEREAYSQRIEALISKSADGVSDGVPLLHEEEMQQLRDSITNAEQVDSEPTVSRIVLYIDDLDRCQPEKVVEVLQAVHLLLSFRLFVVFVAVDVRWVNRALHKCYPQLLAESAEGGLATAHDYLEKIFQVPYWVRPMNATSSAKFMSDRLSLQRSAASGLGIKTEEGEPLVEEDEVESPDSADAAQIPADASAGTSVDRARERSFTSHLPHLELTETERGFMTKIACWAGNSPRRLIRFLNVYQVLKASLSVDDAFSELEGEYLELMTQVAIVTGAPDLVDRWHRHLLSAQDDGVATDLQQQTASWSGPGDQVRNLNGILSAFAGERGSAGATGLRKYSALARRFSFGPESAGPVIAASDWR